MKYDWLEKRSSRSVDQLRLWTLNPRLNPDETHINLADYASDLIADNGEKDSFLKLVNVIASHGFIPSDPIVVWKNTKNEKFYVAEGNRRVLALKLLREPDKAPRSIRSYIREKSSLIERDSIEKIKVSVAPSLEECEWYINQRHATSSLQRSWSRLQQQRWIVELYDKYGGDVEKVKTITGLSKSQLDSTIRILWLRDLALKPEIINQLNAFEQEKIRSHRIPMTILERWFDKHELRKGWGIVHNEEKVEITSDLPSFCNAYATLLKFIIHRDDKDFHPKVNTRTITDNFEEIFKELPPVSLAPLLPESTVPEDADTEELATTEPELPKTEPDIKPPLLRNPNRNQIVVNTTLNTSNFKLNSLFREFKILPVGRYRTCAAASLRVFLDVAVNEYISTENRQDEVKTRYRAREFYEVRLQSRLEFIKQEMLSSRTPSVKVVNKLLYPENDFSLDTLNSYVHGSATHNINKQFINRFWDFLFPLFEKILDIKES